MKPRPPPIPLSEAPVSGPRGLLHRLGPGLITGAADDDPSGIVTYTQAGAQFGYALGWSLLLTLPLMGAVQEISARLGRVTGHGLGTSLRRFTPRWFTLVIVALLLIANVINLGADLGAMAATAELLVGGPISAWAALVALFCAAAEIWLAYKRYVTVLKWMTASLLAYVALLFVVRLPLGEVISGLLVPRLAFDRDTLLMLMAVLGTTISPYLFFWQAAEEAEDEAAEPDPRPLREHVQDGAAQIRRIELDTWTGMVYSNGVALAIMIGAAATLHAHGITNVATAADAAAALVPVAGRFAGLLFALGIFGTGLLAIPVLAGSCAYAVGEALNWTVGLSRRATQARAFYATLSLATIIGLVIALSPIDPIKALVWAAVINGAVSAPMIATMVVLGSMPRVMGRLVLPRWLRAMGWLTAALMAASTVAMLAA